jgi:hypothetical protein
LSASSPIQFEGIKTAFRQSKDGFSLSLAIHPDEVPAELMRDFVGSRYMVVMVRLGDDDQPMVREDAFPGDAAVKAAGIVCRDPEFWEWLFQKQAIFEKTEAAAKEFLYGYIGIETRKELKTDASARDLFNQLKKTFDAWKGAK